MYLTNAVKHFKFEQRGKRRIHKAPSRTEVVACQPWLLAEINTIRPDVVVLLGATAAKSLLGSSFRLTAHRGEALRLLAADATADLDVDPQVVATTHPSAVLRGPPEDRERRLQGARRRSHIRGRAPCTREMMVGMRSPDDHVARLTDGRIIGYAQYGDPNGFPVVNAHGGLACRLDVEAAAPIADQVGIRLISPDRPGIGLSDPLPGRTILDWAHDIGELLDQIDVDRFAVMGWSMGGQYAAASVTRSAIA